MIENIEKKTAVIFFVAAVFVIALSFFAPDIFERARAPLQSAGETVSAAAGTIAAGFADSTGMTDEIIRLRTQNARLTAELGSMEYYKREVTRLRNVLEMTWGMEGIALAEGRLIAENRGPYRRTFSFSCDEASEGALIIDDVGLIGVVTALSNGVAEGAFLTDPGFSVGVRSVRTGDRAVASGDFSLMEAGRLVLTDYDPRAFFAEGDLLETLAEGIPVGVVDEDGNVRPATGLSNFIYVVKNNEAA